MLSKIRFVSDLVKPNEFASVTYFCRQLFLCVGVGLWAGLIIGFVTEYYTSNAYRYLVFLAFTFLPYIVLHVF